MVENIVFVILVILAIGAGVWVWHMEVSGTPIVPPKSPSDTTNATGNNQNVTDADESA